MSRLADLSKPYRWSRGRRRGQGTSEKRDLAAARRRSARLCEIVGYWECQFGHCNGCFRYFPLTSSVWELDHINPFANWRNSGDRNYMMGKGFQLLCKPCNASKGARLGLRRGFRA